MELIHDVRATGGTEMRGLALERVRIRLGDRHLLDLHATVEAGQTLTIMGPSGSGKSTLLDFLCGTLAPAFSAEGRVLLDGEDITALPPERRHLGILFQDALLFPHLSVAGNLLVALPPQRGGRAERRAKVAAALAEAGLKGFGERDPATLSGGQQARVALMRTLLANPRALLLDEPFSKLDATLRQRIRSFVFGEIRRYGLPAVLVTHDPEDAAAAGGPVHRLGLEGM
jgi:putative thiamine transport system ATP-binding protein